MVSRLAQCAWIILAAGGVLLGIWATIQSHLLMLAAIVGAVALVFILLALCGKLTREGWEEFWESLAAWCFWW